MRGRAAGIVAGALVALTVAAATAEASIWQRVVISDPGCQSDITAIEYQAADRLWYTTINGEICRRVGGTFRNELSKPGEQFTDIEFQPGGNVGIAVGRLGLMYRSTDGGDTWFPVSLTASNSKFDCRQSAGLGSGLNADFTHVRFASDNVIFAFADARQIFRSDDAGADWDEKWNSFNPKGTPSTADDECRYDGKVEDAFFFAGSSGPSGVFTGSGGTRPLRSLADATTTNSGLEGSRPQGPCSDGCVLAGDPARPSIQVAIDKPHSISATEDGWNTRRSPLLPNRGSRAYPDVLDMDHAGGVTLIGGRGGQLFNSSDLLRNAYYIDPPADVLDVDFNAVSLASPQHGAAGGSRGVLLVTDQADYLTDVIKPVLGAINGPAEIVLGQSLALSVNPTDQGHGIDPAAVTWSVPGLEARTGTSAAWTPAAAGTYTVTVTASDRAGNAADPVTRTFRVLDRPTLAKPAATFRFPRGSGILRPRIRRAGGRRVVAVPVRGVLGVPPGLDKKAACSGNVTITVTARIGRRTRRLARGPARVSPSTCRFARESRFARTRLRGRRMTVTLEFPGNSLVARASYSKTVTLPR